MYSISVRIVWGSTFPAQAITALYDLLKSGANAATKLALIAEYDTVLGLGLIAAAEKQLKAKAEQAQAESVPSDDPFIAEIEDMIRQRKEAKAAKNYALADSIRQTLAERGVTLIDTPQGTTYKFN